MRALSPNGQRAVDDIARRHGFSPEATRHMLDAVQQGHGGMAQFGHPEFSGSGQWMRGGMTMVSDMFNHTLKGRVDALCVELSQLVGGTADLYAPLPAISPGAFVQNDEWWGPSLRWPNSTGSQNGMRYAVFSQARRLAVDAGGAVTIYDTLDHQIGGVSQQQSGSSSLSFTSQFGAVDVGSLPIVGRNGAAAPAAPAAAPTGDVFATIERLAELRAGGVLSEEEFAAKKAELLSRV